MFNQARDSSPRSRTQEGWKKFLSLQSLYWPSHWDIDQMKQTPCFVTPVTSCHVMWRHVTWCDVMLCVFYVTSDYSSERCSVLVCEVCTVAVHFINFQIDTSTLYILHYTTRTKVIPMTVKLYSKSVRHLLYYTVLESTQSKSSHRICTIEMIWKRKHSASLIILID